MHKTKYIKLYEEYNDLEEKVNRGHFSWSDVRDAIQTKLPFIIIDFKNKSSFDKCIKEELFDEKYTKQKFFLKRNDDVTESYPSIFLFADDDTLKDRVLNLTSRYEILRMIVGEYGTEEPKLYIDSEEVPISANLYTSNDIDDLDQGDYYQMDAHYYKFIN